MSHRETGAVQDNSKIYKNSSIEVQRPQSASIPFGSQRKRGSSNNPFARKSRNDEDSNVVDPVGLSQPQMGMINQAGP